ncbi:hypothetical protein [Nostoc sp.]|uniref:hypothetical protein n=1 Tax=Nostoc sp. TaxID=1180 RepID=UPI002FFCE1BA
MGVHGLAVSRDGQILFSGNWGLLKAWDWQMGKELYNLRAHSIQIYCLAISLNRLWLVAAGTKLLKSEDWLKDNITS